MKVWSYWQGPMPEYIKICVETIDRHCPGFTLLTPDNIEGYLPDGVLSQWWRCLNIPAHRADCIRVAIVNHYGGLWVDCDTVFMYSIQRFAAYVEFIKSDFIYTRWNDGRCLNGYFWGNHGNPVTGEWLKKINNILNKGGGASDRQWTGFGEKILTPIINSGKYRNIVHEMDRRIFLPINFDRIPFVFLEPIHWSSFVVPDTVAIALNHSWLNAFAKHFTGSLEPWDGDGLINNIIREAR